MATWHHLNGQLFMPVKMLREMPIHPREMTTADVPTVTRAGRPVSEEESFWRRKSDEAYNVGIHESIRREGIVNPVRVHVEGRELGIRNGYHRVAAAHDIDPTMFVPITYGTPQEAQSERLPAHVHREGENPKFPVDDSGWGYSDAEYE